MDRGVERLDYKMMDGGWMDGWMDVDYKKMIDGWDGGVGSWVDQLRVGGWMDGWGVGG